MFRTPLKHRIVIAGVAMIASTATLVLMVLAPLATHGGLA